MQIHSRSLRSKQINPRKVYVIDTGLANAFLHQPQPDWGRLLENHVFMELRRRETNIEYYRTAQGHEVDFLVTSITGARALYQVSFDLHDPTIRQREVQALYEAMTELDISQGTIVTLEDQETIEGDAGVIRVLPAWMFATGERFLAMD